MTELKARYRARIRARRAEPGHRAQSEVRAQGLVRSARDAGLLAPADQPAPTPAGAVAAYITAAGEPDVGPLRSAYRDGGTTVLLPIPRPDHTLAWAVDDGRYRDDPRLPVQVPAGRVVGVGAQGLIDAGVHMLVIPALAVETTGIRLGQGGGYYDRLLAEFEHHPSHRIQVVAVVHDDELLPAGALPCAAHDLPVHAALTPTRYVPFTP